MKANMEVELVTPRTPRFLRIAGTVGVVSIEKLTDAELGRVADAWRAKLLEEAHWRRTAGRVVQEVGRVS